MKVVIPIAGRGSKFISAGYKEPKPLIMIKGKPMVKWATDALPFLQLNNDLIFIILKEQAEQYGLDWKLRVLYGAEVKIIISQEITDGAACTILLAKDLINTDEKLIIYNADQYFKDSIDKVIQEKDSEVKGIIPVFRATHQKWSYVLLNEEGYVEKTAEKEPISNLATVGLYYFSHGRDYVWAAEEMIKKNLRVSGEFYVCPVYNELIARGDKIIAPEVKEMWSLGIPEDVEYFKKYYRE
ncbi:MAG: glycosyltransferase family 2 protein [Patescibacteria group bacterium]